jgi:hypothetical protein
MHKNSYLKDILAIAKENAPAAFFVTKNPTTGIFSNYRASALGMFFPRNDASMSAN